MNDELPLVTVIAVCYNHEMFVLNCLESIRAQTYLNIQLVIMDDCSTDRSPAIISDWIESHQIQCNFICHKTNKGLPKTLNEALEITNGKYVMLISTDDIVMPRKIEIQTKIFEDHSDDYGIVFSKVYFIQKDGAPFIGRVEEKLQDHYSEGYVLKDLLERNFICAPSVLIRRSCYEKVGNYDEALAYEDHDMFLRISEFYKFIYSDYISIQYRILSNSMSRSMILPMQQSRMQIYFKWLRRKPELKNLIESKIILKPRHLYMFNHPMRNYYIWRALIKNRSRDIFVLYMFSRLNIPYHFYEKLIEWRKNYG